MTTPENTGSCIVEMHDSFAARQMHEWWHSTPENTACPRGGS